MAATYFELTHRVMPVIEASLRLRSLESVVNIAHFKKIIELGATPKEPISADSICSLSNTDGR
jgi:hypothetical protein